jgi:hypothetical protein
MRRFFALVVKGAVAVLLVQGYLYLRHAYQAPPTLLGQSTKSYVFALLHLDKRTHWVLLLLYVLLLSRLFYTLLRKLFSVESGPMRDS